MLDGERFCADGSVALRGVRSPYVWIDYLNRVTRPTLSAAGSVENQRLTPTEDGREDAALDARGTALNGTFLGALSEHLSALQARDIERFSATVGDEVAVADGAGTMASGRESVLRTHAEWFASKDAWTFDYSIVFTREFRGAGLAVITVTYRQTAAVEPTRFLLSLLFAQDDGGRWKFVFDQNTPLRANI